MPRGFLSCLTVLVIAVLIVMTMFTSIATFYSPRPGISIALKLYEVVNKPVGRELRDITNFLSLPGIAVFVDVEAITPPLPEFKKPIEIVHRALYKGVGDIYIPAKKLLRIAKGWIEVYRQRHADVENVFTGLILRIIVYDARTGKIFFDIYDSISYKPIDILRGKSIRYVLNVVKGFGKAFRIDIEELRGFVVPPLAMKVLELNETPHVNTKLVMKKLSDIGWWYYIERELVFYVEPENLTKKLPSDYFMKVNGETYMKTPVLIVDNPDWGSASIETSIDLEHVAGSIAIYPTLTTGEILSKLKNGERPSVDVQMGSGAVWGGKSYSFYSGITLAPTYSWWAWIWARPIYAIYKVYKCGGFLGTCQYLKDDVEAIVEDVLTSGTTIEGGSELGLPDETIRKIFFQNVDFKQLRIPDTGLADGLLQPGEYVSFRQIIPSVDKCYNDFEIGIPVGVIAAMAICSALGVPIASTTCATAIAFASMFSVSLSVQSPSLYVAGGVENHGDLPYVIGDSNVPVKVFMAVSKFRYVETLPLGIKCYYRVPLGIYFVFRKSG